MKTLTETQMNEIMDNGTIGQLSEYERNQVFIYAFGEEYMSSKNKGKKVIYN